MRGIWRDWSKAKQSPWRRASTKVTGSSGPLIAGACATLRARGRVARMPLGLPFPGGVLAWAHARPPIPAGFRAGTAAGREWGARAGALMTMSILRSRAGGQADAVGLEDLVSETEFQVLGRQVRDGLLPGEGAPAATAGLQGLAARADAAIRAAGAGRPPPQHS